MGERRLRRETVEDFSLLVSAEARAGGERRGRAAEARAEGQRRPYSLPRSPASSRGRIRQNAVTATSMSAATTMKAAPQPARDMPPARSSV